MSVAILPCSVASLVSDSASSHHSKLTNAIILHQECGSQCHEQHMLAWRALLASSMITRKGTASDFETGPCEPSNTRT